MFYSGAADAGWESRAVECVWSCWAWSWRPAAPSSEHVLLPMKVPHARSVCFLLGLHLLTPFHRSHFQASATKQTISCSFGSLLVCPPAGSPGGFHLCGSLRGTQGKHAGRPGGYMWLQKVMTETCFPAFLNVDVMWPFGQKRATHLQ